MYVTYKRIYALYKGECVEIDVGITLFMHIHQNVRRNWTTLVGNYEVLDLSGNSEVFQISYIYSNNHAMSPADNAFAIGAIHGADKASALRYRQYRGNNVITIHIRDIITIGETRRLIC